MELRHIRYFLALAEKLSFTRAAEQMHVSQSTLSHQIRQLEDELGRKLVTRGKRKVALTDEGQLFLPHAVLAVSELESAALKMKSPLEQSRGRVRVVALPSLAISLLPDALNALFASHPEIHVVVEETSSTDEIQRRLIEESADFGILYPPLVSDELMIETLYDEPGCVMVAAGHPLATKTKIRLLDLHGQRIILPLGRMYRQTLEGLFRSVGAQPVIALELSGFATLHRIVAATGIAAVIPRYAASPSAEFRIIPIERPLPMRSPSLCFKRSRAQPVAVNALTAAIRQIAATRRSPRSSRKAVTRASAR